MNPLTIVEKFNVFKYGRFGLSSRFKQPTIQPFLLELAPERFHRGIVITITLTTHTACKLIFIQNILVFFTHGYGNAGSNGNI
jgi:hypothetical protein